MFHVFALCREHFSSLKCNRMCSDKKFLEYRKGRHVLLRYTSEKNKLSLQFLIYVVAFSVECVETEKDLIT